MRTRQSSVRIIEIMEKRLFYIVLLLLISAETVFSQDDSLRQLSSDSIFSIEEHEKIIIPSTIHQTKVLGQFLFGSGLSEERGVGIGVRATYFVKQNTFIGGTFVIHFGPTAYSLKPGYGTMYYLGGEIGGRVVQLPFSIEPLLSFGQALVQNPNVERSSSMESKLYIAPGISLKTLFDGSNVGIHVRYLKIDEMAFVGLYLSYGV